MTKEKNWLSNKAFRSKGILVLILTFCIQYMSCCLSSDSYNVLVVYLPKLYGWTETQIANAYTIGGLVAIAAGLWFGHLISKIGPVKVAFGSFLVMGIAQIAMAVSGSFAVYTITWIVLKSLGVSLAYCLATITSNWFVKYRGRALGINTMGGPLETATGVALLTWGCGTIGFAKIYSIFGVAAIVIGFLFLFLLKDKPEDCGLLPDGDTDVSAMMTSEVKEENSWSIKKIFTTKDSILLIIGMTIVNFVMMCMMIYFIARFLSAGYEQGVIVSAMSIGGLCAIPVSYLYGWLDDKFGTPKACVVYTVVLVTSTVALALADKGYVFLIISAFGVASATGGLPNLHPSISSYVYGRNQFMYCHKYAYVVTSIATAFCATFMAQFGALGVAQGGTASDGYVIAYWIMTAALVAAIACFCLIGKGYDEKNNLTLGGK